MVDLGSDQTSCHNPFNGGYYPVQLSFSEAQSLMSSNPAAFKHLVQERWATGKSSRSRRVLTSLSLSFLKPEMGPKSVCAFKSVVLNFPEAVTL